MELNQESGQEILHVYETRKNRYTDTRLEGSEDRNQYEQIQTYLK